MSQTPQLDELKKGPWPSFVKEIENEAETKPMAKDLLGQLEMSYRDKITHWKHGGVVGVRGYGAGIIGRYTDSPDQFPGVAHFHTIRVNQPSGLYYTSKGLGEICDIWEKHGSGLTNLHGSTGDMVLLGCRTEDLEPVFEALTQKGWDLGGSGSDLRTPSCCLGMSRCEFACIDTMEITNECTHYYQDEMHRPAFPYKFKIKVSGCPNDCVASIARSDMSIIGTWRDDIRIDQDQVKAYVDGGMDIVEDVAMHCPTKCVSFKDGKIEIDNDNCVHCMHCINVLPKALRIGTDTGAVILLGAKAPIVEGAMMASVIVPFLKMEEPFEELKELIEEFWDIWDENGKNKERIGEFIERMGKGEFVTAIGQETIPEMVKQPRENPYIFYDEFFVEE